MPSPWYPPPIAYYVREQEAREYPLRLVHPTCEPGKASVDHVQVWVVKRLSILTDVSERECIVAGMREKEGRFLFAVNVFRMTAPIFRAVKPYRSMR